MSDNITIAGKTVALDDVTIEGASTLVPRDKVGFGSPGSYVDVDASHPLPVADTALGIALVGTFAYASGVSATTVDVPTDARLTRVSAIAGTAAGATVTIGGGATINIPPGGSFDEQLPGQAIGADVVIGGTVQSYYVAWIV